MRNRFFLIIFLVGICSCFSNAQNFWEQTGGPTGGDVRALAVNLDGDIYAGTWGAGIFRSRDNGDSWVQVNQGLTNFYINDFAIHPGGMIFAGAYNAGGVFFSTNNGNFWHHTLPGISILSLTTNASGDVFAGTNGAVNNGIGLYRSTDAGQNWLPLTNGLPGFISVLSFAIQVSGEIYLGSNDGIYRSFDNGNNWMQVGLAGYWVSALAIHPNGDIFAGTGTGTGTGTGIYRSNDNGNTWLGLTGGAVESISINSAGHLFAGSAFGGVLRSLDNGNSWVSVNNGLYNREIWATAINFDDHIFAGTFGGGVFHSVNNGDSWAQTNTGFINTDIYALAVRSDNTLFAGTRGNGLFSSTDQGENWSQSGFQGQRIQAIAISSMNHIFVGEQGMFRSTDNGLTWMQINNGLPPGVGIYAILIKPGNNYIFLATNLGGYRSTDNGDLWSYIGPPPQGKATALAMNSHGHIYIGFDHSGFVAPPWGVHVSTDDGNSWTYLGLFFYQISTLAVNSQDHIFAGTFFSGIYRSTDYGNSWGTINNGLNHSRITSIAINPSDHLFAGTWFGGVYRSEDNGNSWNQVNSGLPYATVFSLAINYEGYIFAGTLDGGVFRSVNPITSIDNITEPIPLEFFLEQNYPNPFNPQTTIEFYSPRKEKIIIEIFNILGIKVETLYEGEATPGKHRLIFDASGLPSGIYMYRLKTPRNSLTKKMVLLR